MFPKGENGNTGPFHPLKEEGLDAGDPRLTARIEASCVMGILPRSTHSSTSGAVTTSHN